LPNTISEIGLQIPPAGLRASSCGRVAFSDPTFTTGFNPADFPVSFFQAALVDVGGGEQPVQKNHFLAAAKSTRRKLKNEGRMLNEETSVGSGTTLKGLHPSSFCILK
jgi:hypothetical protein